MSGVCVTCGRPFETAFTLPTNECDECFNARYDAAPPEVPNADPVARAAGRAAAEWVAECGRRQAEPVR